MSEGDDIDTLALTSLWADRWPMCRPIAHELRHCASDRWVRFHSLPESKRYAENDDEYAEVLRRHNTVIDELQATRPGARTLLVITCSWSDAPAPVPRDEALEELPPTSTYWQSVLRETDGDWEFWNHLFVFGADWRPGILDGLLLLAADDRTGDVIVTEPGLRWLYHPYDGGADVIATSAEERRVLSERHRDWLSGHPTGL